MLYADRSLFDYPDKQLSIIPTENWAYYARYRVQARRDRAAFDGFTELLARAVEHIAQNGPVCAEELPLSGKIVWHSQIHWSGNWGGGASNVARSVLEQLYSEGRLVIHHKKGSRKYYDLAERHIPTELLNAPDPLPDDHAHRTWRMLRRIGAAGLIWDRPSGFWNNVWELTEEERHAIFAELTEEGALDEVRVKGLTYPLYALAEDEPLLRDIASGAEFAPRCVFLAPLDPFLWDKELIRAIFGFGYSWEIYTPAEKRKFGAYVLPVLYGERFIGRIEAVNERATKTLCVRNFWYEDGVKPTKTMRAAVDVCVKRFARFNDCDTIRYDARL